MPKQLKAQRGLELALLRGAEDCLEEYGWCQGSLQNFEGKYCLVGALNASKNRYEREHYGAADTYVYAGLSMGQSGAAQAADNLVEEMEKKYRCRSLIHWNDDDERTEDDVMKLLADMIQEKENTDEGSRYRSEDRHLGTRCATLAATRFRS